MMHLAELEVYGFYLWWLLRQKLSCLRAGVTCLIQQRQAGLIMLEVSLLF